MAHNTNAGAYRADTALMATFDLNPIIAGVISVRNIRLDYYCRSYSIRARPVGFGFPGALFVAMSRDALLGAPTATAGYEELGPFDPAIERFFWKADEGPPYIWVANTGAQGVIRVHFEYFPTYKRDGSQPMVSSTNRDFPRIIENTATIVPGV